MDKMREIFEDKDKIKKICSFIETTPFDRLKKHSHYKFSLLEKNTDEKELKKIYSQIDKIELVCLRRTNKSGKILENYDFHYNLGKNSRAIIAINFNENPPLLINGFFCTYKF